jgi:hypothetical protein
MFRFVPRFAAVLFLVVAGAVAPAAAQERPFDASGGGRVDSHGSSLFGKGKATHLGRCAFTVNYLDEGFLDNGYFFPTLGLLTSTNGDQLYFHFDKDFYLFDPEIAVVSTRLTFTGGTGRFQGATGTADLIFVFVVTGSDGVHFSNFSFVIDGSIDY